MSKILLSFGLAVTVGSGTIVYDHSTQSAKTPGEVMDMMQYGASLQSRVVNLMEPAPRPRFAVLPQSKNGIEHPRSTEALIPPRWQT